MTDAEEATVGRTGTVPDMEPDALKQLALDWLAGRVFSSAHIPAHDDRMLGSVFMVIALGAFNNASEEYVNSIGLVYEYIDKAGPRSINGYPCFFSMRLLSRADMPRLQEMIDKLKAAVAAV